MNEELEMRENSEGAMLASDEAATFEPFEMPADGDIPDLSDDDIAASLGFITTLGEQMLPPPQEEMEQEEAEEAPLEEDEELENEEVSAEKPDEDPELEAEIADIRAELEALKEDIQDDEETEDTDTAE